MDEIFIEIDKYIQCSDLTTTTKATNKKHLEYFVYFLAARTNTDYKLLHLEKIYVLKDSNNRIIMSLPIKAQLVDDFFKSQIDRGYWSLYKSKSALSSFFQYLNRQYDFENIMLQMKFRIDDYKPMPKSTKILSRHDIIKFLQSIVFHSKDLKRDMLMFTILLHTGCRISELLNMRVCDINPESETVLLEKTKTKRQRYLVLREGYGDILEKYCEQEGRQLTDYIFLNSKKGKMNRSSFLKLFKYYLSKSNLSYVKIHSLRHSFATHMFESGASNLIIQQLLGHSSLQSTEIYIHPNYTRNSAVKIPENEFVYQEIEHLI